MAGSTLESPPAGLRVLADVVDILAAGFVTEDELVRVTAVLRRGLDVADARLWLRAPAGGGFRLLAGPPPAGEGFAPTDAWFRQDLERERIAGGGMRLRFPLVFEDQAVGALELRIAGGRSDEMAIDVGRVVARLLGAAIAATELSQDRSEEHTSELQSPPDLVCRLL